MERDRRAPAAMIVRDRGNGRCHERGAACSVSRYAALRPACGSWECRRGDGRPAARRRRGEPSHGQRDDPGGSVVLIERMAPFDPMRPGMLAAEHGPCKCADPHRPAANTTVPRREHINLRRPPEPRGPASEGASRFRCLGPPGLRASSHRPHGDAPRRRSTRA